MALLNTLRCLVSNILDLNNAELTENLLLSKENLDNVNNTSILDATIKQSIETKRFYVFSGCHVFNIDIAFKIYNFILFFIFVIIIFTLFLRGFFACLPLLFFVPRYITRYTSITRHFIFFPFNV